MISWRVAYFKDGTPIIDSSEGVICVLHKLETKIDHAKLIAAAPDMLHALEHARGAISPACEITRDIIRKAIAKARGVI